MQGLARNPAAPEWVLLAILREGRLAAFSMLYDPGLPEAVFDAIVADPDPAVRTELATSRAAPGVQRGRLVDDPEVAVRRQLADGPHPFRQRVDPLPDPVFARLVSDPDPEVRSLALQRWPTPPDEVVDGLLDDPDPSVRTVAAARSWNRHPRLLREIVHTPEDMGHVWWKALVAAAFEPATLADPRLQLLGYRSLLAENPNLPDDLVTRLASDPDHAVRLAVSMRYDLSEDARAAIDYRVDPQSRIMPAHWASTTEDQAQLRTAAESGHLGLRRSAACNRALPPDLMHRLAEDEDFAVRLLLCENHPDAPAELLWRSFFEAKVITRWELLEHPNFPTGRLGAFAASDDPEQRWLAIRDRTLPAELIDRLSRDPKPLVRRGAAMDPRLGPRRMVELLHDADPIVARDAARNPLLPVEAMTAILTDAGIGR